MAENKEKNENVKKSKKVDGRYRCFLGSIYNVQNSKVLVAENVISRKPVIIKMGTSFKPFYVVKAVVNASTLVPALRQRADTSSYNCCSTSMLISESLFIDYSIPF